MNMLHSLFVSLPVVVCGMMTVEIWLSLLRRPDRARRLLLAWSATATVLYACHFLFFNEARPLIPFSDTVYTAANLAVFPLYLIYISELTEPVPLFRKPMACLLWMLPAVIGTVIIGSLYAAMSAEETASFVDGFLYSSDFKQFTALQKAMIVAHQARKVVFAIEVLAVVVVGSRKVNEYNNIIDQLYTENEERSLPNIRLVLGLVGVTALFSFAFNIIGRHFFLGSWSLLVPSLLFTLLLFAIGQFGLHQDFYVQNVLADHDDAVTTQPSRQMQESVESEILPDDNAEKVITKEMPPGDLLVLFRNRVETEQLYLQPDLKLNDVARKLGTNRTYLLSALKEGMQMTFTEYINRLRIAYAARLKAEQPDLTRNELALRSGYASERSFYRNQRLFGNSKDGLTF